MSGISLSAGGSAPPGTGGSPRAGRKLWLNGPAYLQIMGMRAQAAYIYRVNAVLQLVSVLLQIYMLRAVWTAIYAGQTTMAGLHLSILIASLTLANLQIWALSPSIAGIIQGRIFSGQVALDLARPAGFLGQMMAQQVGGTLSTVPLVVVALPVGLLWGSLVPPASVAAALLYLCSLVLAYLIGVLTSLLLGLVAFWTLQLTGLLVIYRFVTQFFAGALVPFAFFPPALRAVATVLPFQAQAYLPVSLYLGQLHGGDVLRALLVQGVWIVVLWGLAQVVWRRAVRRVVVQGG